MAFKVSGKLQTAVQNAGRFLFHQLRPGLAGDLAAHLKALFPLKVLEGGFSLLAQFRFDQFADPAREEFTLVPTELLGQSPDIANTESTTVFCLVRRASGLFTPSVTQLIEHPTGNSVSRGGTFSRTHKESPPQGQG